MPCSRVFRSSAPSEHLPSSPGGRRGRRATVDAAVLNQGKWGVGPGAACHIDRVARQGRSGRHAAGAGPLWGRAAGRVIQDRSRVLGAPRRTWTRHGNDGARYGSRGRARAAGQRRHRPLCADQVRDMAVGRTSGQLPGQVTDQLAAWPQGPQMASNQPPASAKLCRSRRWLGRAAVARSVLVS